MNRCGSPASSIQKEFGTGWTIESGVATTGIIGATCCRIIYPPYERIPKPLWERRVPARSLRHLCRNAFLHHTIDFAQPRYSATMPNTCRLEACAPVVVVII